MSKFARIAMTVIFLFVSLAATAAQPAPSRAESEELFRIYSCQPNTTKGNGTGVIYSEAGGLVTMRPEMETYVSKEGGTCKFLSGNVLTIHMSSPSPIAVKTDRVTYAETNFLIATGLTFEFSFKAGQVTKGWQIQIWYSFPTVDPFAPIVYPAVTPDFFPATGHRIDPVFSAYWRTSGGLAQFGLPISEPGFHWLNGRLFRVQYFERARFEYHPEIANPQYQILLGQFGRQIAQARLISFQPAQPAKDHTCTFFVQTSHNLCGSFGEYWTRHGGLSQFGYPLTEEFNEKLEDGKTYTVQYFERARFEYHPENPAPYEILLGQFGRPILESIRDIRVQSSK